MTCIVRMRRRRRRSCSSRRAASTAARSAQLDVGVGRVASAGRRRPTRRRHPRLPGRLLARGGADQWQFAELAGARCSGRADLAGGRHWPARQHRLSVPGGGGRSQGRRPAQPAATSRHQGARYVTYSVLIAWIFLLHEHSTDRDGRRVTSLIG